MLFSSTIWPSRTIASSGASAVFVADSPLLFYEIQWLPRFGKWFLAQTECRME